MRQSKMYLNGREGEKYNQIEGKRCEERFKFTQLIDTTL